MDNFEEDTVRVSEETWGNIRHTFWILMRTCESQAEETGMLFDKRDVEAAYQTWNSYFDDGDKNLQPSWADNS